MNVGFFSELYHPDVNGTVTSMAAFADGLERAGHAVDVFAPAAVLFGRLGDRRSRDRIHRFHSIDYPPYPGFRLSFPLYSPVRGEIDRLALDVVHSHTPFSLGIFAMRVAHKQAIPHVHTYHTRWPQYAKHYMPGAPRVNERLVERCLTAFCNATDGIIAPSEAIRDRLRSDGVRSPIEVVPTPVCADGSAARRAPAIRRAFGIPADAPLLVTVGRLGAEKSVDFLLRGFGAIRVRRPDARLLVVGDGPLRAGLEALAMSAGLGDAVVFAGAVADRVRLWEIYAAADLYVCASRTETQCLTLLEAAAAGLPLLARYDEPLAAVLESGVNGTFVGNRETDFAAAAAAILGDRNLARRYGEASKRIAGRSGRDSCTRRLVEVYERAAAARAAA